MEAAGRRLEGGRQRRAEHDGVGAAGDGLGDVAALGHAAVGDHVHVDAGLVEVAHAGAGHVGDGGGLGDAEAEHAPGGAGVARADADQHADRAGAHEVQPGLVGGAAAHDDRDVELADEALQVERLRGLGHVLGRDDRALDDQQVQLGGQDGGGQLLGPLGRHRGGRGDPGLLHLADAGGDQLGDDRLLVHLLHPGGGLLVVELADLVEERGRVLVAGPEALEVEHAEAAQAPELDGRGRAHHPVHGRAQQRQLEAVGVDLPGDVDVLGVPGAPAGDDGDVVEPVGPVAPT